MHGAQYHPIESYALIGDCHGCALVAGDGRIDWAALQRFDADPVFCRVLDAARGGFWSIRPRGAYRCTRAYLPDTNILRTVFSTDGGSVALTDFMPVGRRLDAGVHDYVHLSAPGWIVRRVEALRWRGRTRHRVPALACLRGRGGDAEPGGPRAACRCRDADAVRRRGVHARRRPGHGGPACRRRRAARSGARRQHGRGAMAAGARRPSSSTPRGRSGRSGSAIAAIAALTRIMCGAARWRSSS